MKTTIRKSMHGGWMAKSMTEPNANGKAYEITTSKSGNSVRCYTHQVTVGEDMYSFSATDKITTLATEVGMCNEKRVAAVHAKGIENFNVLFAEKLEENIYVIEVGQILFTYGYANEHRRVVYAVCGGGRYKTVSLDGKTFKTDDFVESYTKKRGIGVYYNEGDKLPLEDINNLVIAANNWQEMLKNKQNEAAKEQEEYKANAILKGSEIISSIPTDATNIIIAELQEDESDFQTDYHASKTIKTVYLAFSIHDRNMFNEMRKASENFEDTAHYSIKNESYEHKENYSGGSGYYLGKSKYSGWIIRKASISHQTLEKLQIAAFENRFFCNGKKELVTA